MRQGLTTIRITDEIRRAVMAYREAENVTQAKLAKRLGISRKTVLRIENGESSNMKERLWEALLQYIEPYLEKPPISECPYGQEIMRGYPNLTQSHLDQIMKWIEQGKEVE